MRLCIHVTLPNVLKSALLFEELGVILCQLICFGIQMALPALPQPPLGKKSFGTLKKMIKNSLLFIMMDKCHWELNVLSEGKCGCLEKAVGTRVELMRILNAPLQESSKDTCFAVFEVFFLLLSFTAAGLVTFSFT